jgi:hypothetical protein
MSTKAPTPMDTTAPTTTTTTTAPKAKRKANAWITHVSAFRKANSEQIKAEKMSCGTISKLARQTYKPRAKCPTCGK